MDAQTQAENIAKLDVGLVQVFTAYRVAPVMAMFAQAGVDTVETLAHSADDKTLFRAAFTFTVGLNPDTGPKAVQMSHVGGGLQCGLHPRGGRHPHHGRAGVQLHAGPEWRPRTLEQQADFRQGRGLRAAGRDRPGPALLRS